jgi:hypothetical protein
MQKKSNHLFIPFPPESLQQWLESNSQPWKDEASVVPLCYRLRLIIVPILKTLYVCFIAKLKASPTYSASQTGESPSIKHYYTENVP